MIAMDSAGMVAQMYPWASSVAVASGGLLCALSMTAIVVFDSTTRLIPRFLCGALACAGIVLQLFANGAHGVMAGVLWAVAVLVSVAVLTWVSMRVMGMAERPIGGGDVRCMVALSLATGPGAPWGLAACFLSAAAWAVLARVQSRLLPGEPFAFAPFLAIWLAVGVLASI